MIPGPDKKAGKKIRVGSQYHKVNKQVQCSFAVMAMNE